MAAFVRQSREYQQWARDAFFAYFMAKAGHPVIAMPTGTGKSVTIADICIEIVVTWNGQRILILAPTKELVTQNAAKFAAMAPQIPVGVCSASLNKYQLGMPITMGTIGTIYNRRASLGHIDLVFIDECHLVSHKEETQYRRLADWILTGETRELEDGTIEDVPNPDANPNCKFVGLSATPYRLGLGHITDGGLFTDVCFDACGLDAFNWFIDQGYLVPLIPRPTRTVLDTVGVKTSGGDFVSGDLQRKVNKAEITSAAVAEALELSSDRHKVLWFATGIDHAESIVAELEAHGEHAVAVHSKSATRDDDLGAFMTMGANGVRHCVNFGVLTTGFDFDALDCIVMLRPTKSPGLWVQMIGRGTRTWYALGFDLLTQEGRLLAIANSAKQNCLVLDFAYNTAELGPINDPRLPRKKKKGGGDAPIKTCGRTGDPPICNIVPGTSDETKGGSNSYVRFGDKEIYKGGCGAWNHPSARNCIQCNAEFTFEVKFSHTASNTALLKKSGEGDGAFEKPVIEEHKVSRVTYEIHKKDGRPDSIRVNYHCGLRRFTHYVLPEHGGNPRKRSEDWWTRHGGGVMPASTNMARARIEQLKIPNRISVWMKKDYPQIMDWIFDA